MTQQDKSHAAFEAWLEAECFTNGMTTNERMFAREVWDAAIAHHLQQRDEPIGWVSRIGFERLCQGRPVAPVAINRGDDVPLYAASQPAEPVNHCDHRIVDMRNPAIKSGYMCIDCGSLFNKAADHDEPVRMAWNENLPKEHHSPEKFHMKAEPEPPCDT